LGFKGLTTGLIYNKVELTRVFQQQTKSNGRLGKVTLHKCQCSSVTIIWNHIWTIKWLSLLMS